MGDPNWRGYRFAAWASIALLLGAIIWVALQGKWQGAATLAGFAIAAVVFLLITWMPALVDLAVVVAALLNAAGYVWNLYQQFWWFDRIVHGYTLFAITLPLGLIAYRSVLSGFRGHPLQFVVALASFGLAIGAIWELAEWAYDMYAAGNAIKGKFDTMVDLIIDAGGAFAAGWVSIWVLKNDLHRGAV
jgi:hypothetical protein